MVDVEISEKETLNLNMPYFLFGYELWAVMTTSSANKRGPDKKGNLVSVTVFILRKSQYSEICKLYYVTIETIVVI